MLSAATHTEHGSLAHVAALWGVIIPACAVPGSLVVTHGAGRCRPMQGTLTASGSFPRGFPGPGCPPSPPHPLVALEQIFSQGRAPLQPSPPQQKSRGAVFSGSWSVPASCLQPKGRALRLPQPFLLLPAAQHHPSPSASRAVCWQPKDKRQRDTERLASDRAPHRAPNAVDKLPQHSHGHRCRARLLLAPVARWHVELSAVHSCRWEL